MMLTKISKVPGNRVLQNLPNKLLQKHNAQHGMACTTVQVNMAEWLAKEIAPLNRDTT